MVKSKAVTFGVVAMFVLGFLAIFAGVKYMGGLGSVADNKEVITAITTSDFCSNNPDLNLNVRIQDGLASTVSYINGTIYVKNLDTGSITSYSITGANANGAFDSESNIFNCQSKKGYEIYVARDADDYNSDGKVVITTDMLKQDPVEVTILGTKHTLTKWKAYDNDAKSNLYGYMGATYDVDNSSSFYTHNGSTITINTDAAATAKTVGVDGFLDYEFTIAPSSANEQGGEQAILCINYADDTNAADWDGDTLSLTFDNLVLSEATLNANDVLALNAYEKCFALPYPVGTDANGNVKTQHKLDLYIASQSGQNPDYDPVLRYVELSDVQSSKDSSIILENVAFQDDTSKTAVGSAKTQLISINVS